MLYISIVGYDVLPSLFGVMDFLPNDIDLTLRAVRVHEKAVMKHVFERGAGDAKSVGY